VAQTFIRVLVQRVIQDSVDCIMSAIHDAHNINRVKAFLPTSNHPDRPLEPTSFRTDLVQKLTNHFIWRLI
jgi:hypothetical protein